MVFPGPLFFVENDFLKYRGTKSELGHGGAFFRNQRPRLCMGGLAVNGGAQCGMRNRGVEP